jgi:formylglycine-generating enzyme required for sulfatase activity
MPAEQHLFLSYPRSNSKEAAELRQALENDGHVVWQDLNAIQGGDDWVKAIEAGISRAYAVVVIVSAAWPTSRWIKIEVMHAQRMHKTVIPVLVDDSDIPTELLDLHVVHLYGDRSGTELRSLLESLRSRRGAAQASFSAPTPERLAEIGYLDALIQQNQAWSELYTPLAGLGQLPAVGKGPDLAAMLPPWMNIGLMGNFAASDTDGPAALEERTYENISSAIEEMRQLVILGCPGSGKTTTLWYVALQMAQLAKADPAQPLPVLVRLNLIEAGQLLADEVAQQLGPLADRHAELLSAGRIAFLLDGLNALTNPDEHIPQVRELVQDCVRDGRIVVATCRDADYDGKLDLGLDRRVQISPLDPLQVRRYIEGCFQRLEHPGDGETMFWQLAGEPAERCWHEFLLHVGDDPATFWTAVRLPEGRRWGAGNARWEAWVAQRQHPRSLLTLVSNPYLLVMATLSFARSRRIPQNRGLLFSYFVDQLLKERAGLTDPAAAGRLRSKLGALAFNTMSIVGGGAAFDRASALTYLAGADLRLARDADMLSEDASGIRFTHQLLQEYFAAAYLAEDPERTDKFVTSMAMTGDSTDWDEAIIFLGSIYPERLGGISHVIGLIAASRPLLACRVAVDSGMEASVSDDARQSLISRCRQLGRSPEQPVRYRYQVATELGRLNVPLAGDADHLIPISGGSFDYLPGRRPVSDFLIARYPVSNREFRAFVDAKGYTTQRYWPRRAWGWVSTNIPEQAPRYFNDRTQPELSNPDAPVVGISWYEAEAFCRWKTENIDPGARRDGWRIRLPTEPEWLVAVRGASGRLYPWGDSTSNLRNRCQFSGSRLPGPAPVGIYLAGESLEGAGDLLGNVYEFVTGGDAYLKGCRGGSWQHDAERLMDYQSETVAVDERTRNDVGFRYVYARR